MLSKESSLKELINEVVIIWFKSTVNEKAKRLRIELEEITQQIPMFLQMGASGIDIDSSINQIQAEVSVLKNLDEIKIYTEKNSFSANETLFKKSNISFESMTELLQKGESLSKMLVKLQLGETFSITNQILQKIDILDTKIGYEEQIKNLDFEDLDYLLNKTLTQWEQELLNLISSNSTDADNVLGEVNEVINTKDWETKIKKTDIIERYFSKFKVNSLFGNLVSPEDLKNKENQEQIINYSKVIGIVHSLTLLIKLNKNILEEFKKITN